jgi:hypothetical protein
VRALYAPPFAKALVGDAGGPLLAALKAGPGGGGIFVSTAPKATPLDRSAPLHTPFYEVEA